MKSSLIGKEFRLKHFILRCNIILLRHIFYRYFILIKFVFTKNIQTHI